MLHVLELRKRINQYSNEIVNVIGVFCTHEKARQWIVENGKTMVEKNNEFFVICETKANSGEIYFTDAYDKNGNMTFLFKRN